MTGRPGRPAAGLRRVLGIAVILLVACAVVVALAGRGLTGNASGATTPAFGPAGIDQSAADQVVPQDAVVNVKTAFGAVGDGRTDDTAAIQRGISAGLGFGNRNKILFFPKGVYLVRGPLEWKLSDGTWSTWLTLMGENRDQTVIRLADGSPGYSDPNLPRGVVVTGSQNAMDADGSGNQAFNNFITHLTVDVGEGNPGASGIDYMGNNRGAIRDVVLRAGDGSGDAGIAMTRRWPGPCMIENVAVVGFRRGIELGQSEYSVTMDQIRLSGQREVGIQNDGNVANIRRLVSRNLVPAVRNLPGETSALVTVLDSQLLGGAVDAVAVESTGGAFLRSVHAQGYRAVVRNGGVVSPWTGDGEWSSTPAIGPPGAPTTSLNMPQADPPTRTFPVTDRVSASTFGADPTDYRDDTTALQAALDSGKAVVQLRPGTYVITRPLVVPPTVRQVLGFEAVLNASTGTFAGSSTEPAFAVEGGDEPLTVSQLVFRTSLTVADVEMRGRRPLDLVDIHLSGTPLRGVPGPVYLTDVEAGEGWDFGPDQEVWARQLNVERAGPKIRNTGAALWVFGLKTERVGPAVVTTAGGRTEVLGGLLYPAQRVVDDSPAFASDGSAQSLTFGVSGTRPDIVYRSLVSVDDGSGSDLVPPGRGSERGLGGMLVLYRNGTSEGR